MLSPLRTDAQDVYHYTLATLPHNLVIVKGTILEISGSLPSLGAVTRFQLRARNTVRAEGRFTDAWSLRWNSADEVENTTALSVFQDFANVPGQIAKIYIRMVDAAPFRISEPVDGAKVFGPTPVKTEAIGSLKATGFTLTVDGAVQAMAPAGSELPPWDPAGIKAGSHLLSVQVRLEDDFTYVIAPVTVTVFGRLTALPFEVGDVVDTRRVNGNIRLSARIAPDIKVTQVSYLIDNQTAVVKKEAPFDFAFWDPTTVQTGRHELSIVITDNTGATQRSESYSFDVRNRPRRVRTTEEERLSVIIPKTPVNALIDDVTPGLEEMPDIAYSLVTLPPVVTLSPGMSLSIVGTFDKVDAAEIRIQEHERDTLAASDHIGRYKLTVFADKLTPGNHKLTFGYAANGSVRIAKRFEVNVYKDNPVHLVIPKGADGVVGTIALSHSVETGFQTRSITYYKDYKALTLSATDPLKANWDSRGDRPGICELFALVTAADGSIVRSKTEKVKLPIRVAVIAPVGTSLISPAVKRLDLTATIADGVPVHQVEYKLDEEVVATLKQAPFTTVSIDPNNFRTGLHNLTVTVTDASGARYISERHTFGNAATQDELAQVTKDVEYRIHLDDLARLRRRDTDSIRQRIAAAGTASIKPKRVGTIARTNGLAVVQQPITLLGGLIEITAVWGEVFPINVVATKGSGKISVTTKADQAFLGAASNAFSCAQNLLPGVDWAACDYHLVYPGATPAGVGGDSAGAANTTALASLALRLPTDNATAMTGTIDIGGNIGDVGGVHYKAVAALSNPTITTLIIPHAMGSVSDLESVFHQYPWLFYNHHFIFATRIEEVLRQAIIGYDPVYDQAQRFFRSALVQFMDGEDEDALVDMEKASALTPEDETMKQWIRVMRIVDQTPPAKK